MTNGKDLFLDALKGQAPKPDPIITEHVAPPASPPPEEEEMFASPQAREDYIELLARHSTESVIEAIEADAFRPPLMTTAFISSIAKGLDQMSAAPEPALVSMDFTGPEFGVALDEAEPGAIEEAIAMVRDLPHQRGRLIKLESRLNSIRDNAAKGDLLVCDVCQNATNTTDAVPGKDGLLQACPKCAEDYKREVDDTVRWNGLRFEGLSALAEFKAAMKKHGDALMMDCVETAVPDRGEEFPVTMMNVRGAVKLATAPKKKPAEVAKVAPQNATPDYEETVEEEAEREVAPETATSNPIPFLDTLDRSPMAVAQAKKDEEEGFEFVVEGEVMLTLKNSVGAMYLLKRGRMLDMLAFAWRDVASSRRQAQSAELRFEEIRDNVVRVFAEDEATLSKAPTPLSKVGQESIGVEAKPASNVALKDGAINAVLASVSFTRVAYKQEMLGLLNRFGVIARDAVEENIQPGGRFNKQILDAIKVTIVSAGGEDA